jgi:putative FmdB family regulatory protein
VPLYDYDCAACGRRFEAIHGVHADPPTACPVCGSGPVRKAITAPAVHFKGSGWAKKERRVGARSGADSGTSGEGTERGEVGAGTGAGPGDGSGDGSSSTTGEPAAKSNAPSPTTPSPSSSSKAAKKGAD